MRSLQVDSQMATTRISKKDMSFNRMMRFKNEVEMDCHTIPLGELESWYNTNFETGMTAEMVKLMHASNGYNELTPTSGESEIKKFIKTLFKGFALLLWVGGCLCILAFCIDLGTAEVTSYDNLYLGIILFLVVIITGMFSYYQENKSSKIMETFSKMIPTYATVMREKKKITILSRELVVGDIVYVKFGDTIPADIRLLECQGLKVDNSALTGESEAVTRKVEHTDANPLESKNLIFFSTNAVEGTAKGVVVACGDDTVMGRIAGLTTRLQPRETPLSQELRRIMRICSIWAFSLGIIFFFACLALGSNWVEAVLFFIAIVVANVPEGMLATVTVCLSLTAKRMASKKCLVKNLEAVETLGSTSVICTDKTGTLTMNIMTISQIWFSGRQVSVNLHTALPNLLRTSPLLTCAALCSRAEFEPDQENLPIMQRKTTGDASESAILKFVELNLGNVAEFRMKFPKIAEIPFSSSLKYQISIHQEEGGYFIVMKGAPEKILDCCKTIFMNGKTITLDDEVRVLCDAICMDFAQKGERVLGFCDFQLDPQQFPPNFEFTTDPINFPDSDLRFLGFLSLVDPPRPQVPEAISECRLAGIKVTMVTGDHPVTAKAIGKAVGIFTEKSQTQIVVHGANLRDMTSDELDTVIREHSEIIFARTSPTQKLQIVESYQRLGYIVAVTGDGVNDSPALKKADIGIAMGIAGTPVSQVYQASADMILMDDNFATIVTGIKQGRLIFDNLKKAICYILASNVPEIIPFLAYITFDIPLPLGVITILCIDLGTDLWPAISLAYELPESDIMQRPPRDPRKDNLVSSKLIFHAYFHLGLIEAVAGFFVYFTIMYEYGFKASSLTGLRRDWDDPRVSSIEDSYGQEWSYSDRKVLESTCHTAFFVAVVVTQAADVIACKTRINSIFHQGKSQQLNNTQKSDSRFSPPTGMHNWILNFGILFEIILACFLSYAPYMGKVLHTYPLALQWWFLPLPFAILLLGYDEFRKWSMRRFPNGYFRRETFY